MNVLTSTISPDPAACGRTVKLGAIDQIAPRVYITSILFYKTAADVDPHKLWNNLRLALYNTVQDIPQLMTVVQPCNNSREELELAYVGGRGAVLSFKDYVSTERARACWPYGTFEEISAADFPYSVCDRRLIASEPPRYSDGSASGLAVQMNYIPGGMILTSQLSHTICDGTGNFLFYQTFAKHCKAVAEGEVGRVGIPSIRFLDRSSVVNAARGITNVDEFPDWTIVQRREAFLNPIDYHHIEHPRLRYAIFFINERQLDRLRDLLSSDVHRPSLIEALGAFLWQQVVQARQVDAGRYPEAKLSIAVDTRSRMTMPIVPSTFWGNLSEPNAVARMSTRDLQQSSIAASVASTSRKHYGYEAVTDGIGVAGMTQVTAAQRGFPETIESASTTSPASPDAAQGDDQAWKSMLTKATQRIRQALVAVDSTAVRRLVALLEQMPRSNSITWNADRWPGPDMLLICVNYQHYNHLDFGEGIGQADAGRFMIGDTDKSPDGRVLLLPPRMQNGRGLEVALQYDQQTLERLQNSNRFMNFFERRS